MTSPVLSTFVTSCLQIRLSLVSVLLFVRWRLLSENRLFHSVTLADIWRQIYLVSLPLYWHVIICILWNVFHCVWFHYVRMCTFVVDFHNEIIDCHLVIIITAKKWTFSICVDVCCSVYFLTLVIISLRLWLLNTTMIVCIIKSQAVVASKYTVPLLNVL